jgi:hypothetical protein
MWSSPIGLENNFQRIEPEFCNEKRTATKKASKKAISICIDLMPETTKREVQTQMPYYFFPFRCGPFFVASQV